ncbi:type I restriction enzyme, S subunit [Zobellia uliginosa]|uniref:Type I restriction enzyme, S subunit n=1 Tax=Zobellia uliginosa TaxID=143224 RepID=A0ABY1KRB7_9FLAO|nr:restriction endonuclease subunit S [Zobellia uliginosa]SIS54362.1 type I restriction enzyme, S subunit [Zobellia uliginosa]
MAAQNTNVISNQPVIASEERAKQSALSKPTKQSLVPALRFKEFEGGIRETSFGKLYSFHTTNSFSRAKLNYDKGIVRNIHYGDIHTKFQSHFYLESECVPFINEDVDLSKVKEESYCKVGDIIIADASEDYADIGKSIELLDLNNEKILAGLHTFLARPISGKTAVGFMSYLLKSWKLRKQIMTIAQGTKVLSLSTRRVSKLKLNLPSLPEQQKIAAFLSAVDQKIQQLTQKKALLEDYKKGVMQQLFSGKLRFKDDDGNDYPDWEEKRLGDILTIGSGRDYKHLSQGDIPVYGTGGYMTSVSEYLFDGDSVGIGRKGTIDKPVFLSGKFWTVDTLFYTHSFKEVLPFFIYLKFQSINWKLYNEASGVPSLSKSTIEKIKIEIPSLPEQQKIASFLSSIDAKIEQVNQQLNQTQTFKKGLLQQMFV